MKIDKITPVLLLVLLLCAHPGFGLGSLENEPGAAGQDIPVLPVSGNSATGIIILPETFLRSYDPVTVFFSTPLGPGKGGPLDKPAGIIRITPEHPGEYRWLDAVTLQFLPAVPWAALSRYEITAGAETRGLVTLMIPPDRITPAAGKTNLEPFNTLTLNFAEALDAGKLAEMVTFEAKPLPGLDTQESTWYTERDFIIKELERTSQSDSYAYQLTLNNAFDYGLRIMMHIRLSLDGTIPGSVARYTFDTKPLFKVRGMGCGSVNYPVAVQGSVYSVDQAVNCGTGRNPLFIEFTESLSGVSVETLKRFVKFEPAVRNLSHNVSGSRIYLYFDTDRETPYRLALQHTDIVSSNGRSLARFGETSFYFYYAQLSPYLKWTEGRGILERFGPQFFPMEGRAMEKIDLRIYKIDALNRNFWPFPGYPVSLDEDNRPPMPGEEPGYGTQMTEQIKLLGTPQLSQVVSLPITENSPGSRFGIDLKPLLAKIAGQDKPGTYLVGYRLPGASRQRYYVRVAVTDLSLSAVEEEHAINFVVTSLATGAPVAGAGISLEADFAGQWRSVVSGLTDSTGQFYYEHKADLERLDGITSSIKRIVVAKDGDFLVLNPSEPPPQFMNNHWFGSSASWLNWLTSEPRRDKDKANRKGFILTERPVYRPEEPVHLIGYVRLRQQGRILADEASRKRQVIVNGPGNKSWTYPVALKSLGSFYIKFDEKDLPTGNYTAYLMDMQENKTLSSITFKKESYRVPRFEINISGPEKTPLDQVFEVVLTADYYAGGRVVGQDVTWEISQYAHQVRPPAYPGYIFSSDERFSQGREYYAYGSSYEEDVTDENGSAVLTLNPAAEDDSLPRRYVIQATVRGADAQTVTAAKIVYALPPFIIGLKTESFITGGKVIRPEIIAIRHDETLLSGKQLQVKLYQRQWHSYLTESDFTTGQTRYTSDVVDTLILTQEYTTTDKPLKPELAVKESGVYVVEVLGWDNLGRMQKVMSDLYVAGDDPVTWKKTQANVFETTTDKKRYAPGETATLLLKSPYQQARALVVVEAPGETRYSWVDIVNGQGLFSFKIGKDMCPTVPVHSLLMRGRISGTGGGAGKPTTWRDDRGKPAAMANTTWVAVDPEENRAVLTLEHEKIKLPGSSMQMSLQLKDRHGNALDGEAALWLVDRAVLALGEEQFADPLYSFIDPVKAHLSIRETRNEVVGNLSVEEIPGSGGEDYDLERKQSLLERTTVRRNFKTVAYFNDNIKITGGRAVITIDLPENLTDFAVRAIAISDFDKFGTAVSTVSIRLPVIVQSALPRFVRPGDAFTAGGIGRVVEGKGGTGLFQVSADGLDIRQGKELTRGSSGKITLEYNRPQQLYFPFEVPGSTDGTARESVRITLALERDYDKARDGFEITLPVKYEQEKSRVESYALIKETADIPLPEIKEKYVPGSVQRVVLITTEPGIINIINGMDFLANYRHGCTEQRISKALPVIALSGLFKTIGWEREIAYNKENFESLAVYLDSTLHSNGLYSYWPGSEPYVSLTAYVVEFLTLARSAGYQFDDKLLSGPLAALKEALRSDYDAFISGREFWERTESLYALGAADNFDSAYAFDLLVAALNSDLYSRSRILNLFLKQGFKDHKDVKTLLNNVRNSMTFKLMPDGKEQFVGFQDNTAFRGGLVLSSETRTLASVTRALYRAEPGNARVRALVEEITRRAGANGWGSTSDNVACLLTLGEILEIAAPAAESFKGELHTGSTVANIYTGSEKLFTYRDNQNTAGFLRPKSRPQKQLPGVYMYADYLPALELDKVTRKNEGFVVSREHLEYDASNDLNARRKIEAGKSIEYALDTIVEEHVQLINSETRYFVAVRVPFAAGFEPLNPQLATSPREAQPAGRLTLSPSYSLYEDDQVTFYYDTLPAGTYDFYFRLRAGFEGSFIQPPAYGELLYDVRVKGRSDGTRVNIAGSTDDAK